MSTSIESKNARSLNGILISSTTPTEGQILAYSSGVNSYIPVTPTGISDGDKGDIIVSSSGTVWAIDALAVQTGMIADQAVTLAKMAHIATNRFLGRNAAGNGVVESLTTTQATAMLHAFTNGAQGLAPASGGGTTNYLRADGTWAAPIGLITAISGTPDYLARWTPNGTSLGIGTIRDNGSTLGINTAQDTTIQAYVVSSLISGIQVDKTSVLALSIGMFSQVYGASTINIGIDSIVTAATSSNVGGRFYAGENAGSPNPEPTTDTGVYAIANSVVRANIGGYFRAVGVNGSVNIGLFSLASGGSANYSIKLQDGTQGVGKFLKSITANGEANWATISTSDISGYAGLSDGDKGDIVVSFGGTIFEIDAGTVTLAKMDVLAANSIIGNNTGVFATPQALSGTQITAMLNVFTDLLKGLVPASGGGTTNFLRADGNWAAISIALGGLPVMTSAEFATKISDETGVGGLLVFNNAPQINNINLGHATDTLITRLSAGQLEIAGAQILTRSNTVTVTNKRITSRVQSVVSAATVTPSNENDDSVEITAQAEALTIAQSTGIATSHQKLIIRIKDNGTARAITWNAEYRAIGVTLPTTTVINKTVYLGFIYNVADNKYDCVAVNQEA